MISIILLTGREGVGKSTVAEYLYSHHDYEELSFAGTLRTAATTMWNDIVNMFEYSEVIAYAPTVTVDDTQDQRTKNNPIHLPIVELGSATHLTMADGRTFTPRVLLQWFGTDIMRNLVADDIWVHSTLSQLRKRISEDQTRFVISDCRFENELAAVRSFANSIEGGAVCKLVRLLPGDVSPAELEEQKTNALAGHPSARGWVTLPADIEVYNPRVQKDVWLPNAVKQILASD
jgi:cytidylate kinase